jgi:hypothetical protein
MGMEGVSWKASAPAATITWRRKDKGHTHRNDSQPHDSFSPGEGEG